MRRAGVAIIWTRIFSCARPLVGQPNAPLTSGFPDYVLLLGLAAAGSVRSVISTVWYKLDWMELLAIACSLASGWAIALYVLLSGRNFMSDVLAIHSAEYGLGPEKYRDVTLWLRGYIRQNKLDILVTNETMGSDPIPGSKKILRVVYSKGGIHKREIVKHENDRLILPED